MADLLKSNCEGISGKRGSAVLKSLLPGV